MSKIIAYFLVGIMILILTLVAHDAILQSQRKEVSVKIFDCPFKIRYTFRTDLSHVITINNITDQSQEQLQLRRVCEELVQLGSRLSYDSNKDEIKVYVPKKVSTEELRKTVTFYCNKEIER